MLLEEKMKNKSLEVCETFSWYKEMLEQKGGEYPLITGEILDKNYYNKDMDGDYAVYLTSGTSSNNRKKIFYSMEDEEAYLKTKSKVFEDVIKNTEIKRAISDMGTGHAEKTAQLIFDRLGLEGTTISFELPIMQHVEKMKEFKPQLLYIMPSILDSIIAAAEDVLEFGVEKIVLVGEVASIEWIKRIAEKFSIKEEDIIDTYGSIEMGVIASYNHEIGRYVIHDGYFGKVVSAEEIEMESDSIKEDEGILVITCFHRKTFPALNFVTYDVVKDFKTIEIGGKKYQTFKNIVKRVGKELKHGEKISIYDIENAVFKHLSEAQIRVTVKNNRLVIYILSNELTDLLLETIKKSINEAIPEIGEMIKNGILEEIQVINASKEMMPEENSKKKKKLYY